MTQENQQQVYIFDEYPTEQGLELQLTNFNGPLDLLLTLVKQNEIEIKDIFLSQVTEQFMSYMSQLSTLDVDKASEYMTIAATLLEIKSRALLPVLPGETDDDSPEKMLIRQLEEYKMFKEVCGELKTHETVTRFYREPDTSVGDTVEVLKENLSLENFMTAFNKFLLKMQVRASTENVSRSIVKETFSIADKMRFINSYLEEHDKVTFGELFDINASKIEVVTTFSAMLELLKLQAISVEQQELFEDIVITKKNTVELSEEVLDESAL